MKLKIPALSKSTLQPAANPGAPAEKPPQPEKQDLTTCSVSLTLTLPQRTEAGSFDYHRRTAGGQEFFPHYSRKEQIPTPSGNPLRFALGTDTPDNQLDTNMNTHSGEPPTCTPGRRSHPLTRPFYHSRRANTSEKMMKFRRRRFFFVCVDRAGLTSISLCNHQ